MVPMVKTERRRVPRMTLKELAYVNLEPNTGGIILDISEGGLCFQSPAPVQRTETIRLWFSYRNPRTNGAGGMGQKDWVQTKGVSRFIEVGSELAWIDQTRKKGGVRFTNLPAADREQIRDWIRQCGPVITKEKSAGSIPSSGKPTFASVKRSVTDAARSSAERLRVFVQDLRLARLRTGFSSGLLVGVIASSLVAAVFLLLSHTRDLGNSLIQIGENLGGRTRAQATSPTQARSNNPPLADPGPKPLWPELESTTSTTSMPLTADPASIRSPLEEEFPSLATRTATKRDGLKLATPNSGAHSPSAVRLDAPDIPTLSSTTSRLSPPGVGIIPLASDSNPSVDRTPAPEMELAVRPGVHVDPSKVNESKAEGTRTYSEKYLEVGKFKEKVWADKATGQLSQLGFVAAIIEKNRWRGKSYQVLVGPYLSDAEAEAAHKHLASLGFTARSLERGTRNFQLPAALRIGGTSLPAGNCVISWESYIPDAVVKIEGDKGTSVTLQGKWVKQPAQFNENATVYQKNMDGSRTLIEIRFHGMSQALVFGGGSS
jgi:cell division septation protein DedD